MKLSIKYEADGSQKKGKPFYLSRYNIEELAQTPVGFGLEMLDALDKPKEERERI
jgi:hypothetical protein